MCASARACSHESCHRNARSPSCAWESWEEGGGLRFRGWVGVFPKYGSRNVGGPAVSGGEKTVDAILVGENLLVAAV